MRRITEFMTQFEMESKHVTVDIDHATETYVNMINSGVAKVMVLEGNGELIGSFAFIIAPDLHSGEKTMIETFWFTDPNKRGRGLKLLDAFEKYADENGADKIAIIHMMDSHPEILEKLYIRRGYELMEKHFIKYLKGKIK